MDRSVSKSFPDTENTILKNPTLVYPDPNKPYTSFMDASKYTWSAVLIQEHTTVIDGKTFVGQHPITYVSG